MKLSMTPVHWTMGTFFSQGTSHMPGVHRKRPLGHTVLDSKMPYEPRHEALKNEHADR